MAHIDVDYHSGNGTASIVYNKEEYYFASFHIDPRYDYPHNSFKTNATTKEIKLKPKTDWSIYEGLFIQEILNIKNFGAQILIVSLGTDGLKGDPDSSPLGGLCLETDDFKKMRQIINENLSIPIMIVQEGGYDFEKGSKAVYQFIRE